MVFKDSGQATAAAEATLALMKTGGWAVRVWDNLGWHYELTRPGMALRPGPCRGAWYAAAVTAEGGTLLQAVSPGRTDPNEAVAICVVRALAHVATLRAEADRLEEAAWAVAVRPDGEQLHRELRDEREGPQPDGPALYRQLQADRAPVDGP